MEQRDSIEYYRDREAVERSMARAAIDTSIAAIHGEMADRYAALVRDGHAAMVPRPPAGPRATA